MTNSESSRTPGTAAPDNNARAARGRWTLILLFALFLAPVFAAIFLNSRFSDWRPESTRNYGQLVSPVIPLDPVLVAPPAGAAFPPWQLLWPRSEACDEACTTQLEELERIRQTLGRHRDKLHIGLIPLPGAPEANPALTAALVQALGERQLPTDALFLIDPLGNLMMAYARPVDSTGLRKDIDRLVRHSKFKEQP